MKKTRMVWLAAVLLVPVVLVSCKGRSDDGRGNNIGGIGDSSNSVPDSAGVGSRSFFDYLFALNMSNESSEPAAIRDGFAIPNDEASEPIPMD